MPSYGKPLRELWHLDPHARFLNHGSYGACPKVVLAEQERLRLEMESQPDRFFRMNVMPREGETLLRAALAPLAAFVGSDVQSMAFIENATAGVQAIVRGMPLRAGDEVLITDHTYNAVRLIVEARCAETGAKVRVARLGFPATADEAVARMEAALTPAVRLAIVDHITSPTAMAFPIGRMVAALRKWDARVLVDGAHGVGQVALDLPRIDADWYVSNAHKWLFAPKGTAFLHAGPRVRELTTPLVISHFVGLGFPRSHDYVATRDYTGWLSVPAAIRFFESLEPAAARAYRAKLIARATQLMEPLGARPAASGDFACSMRSFVLPLARTATLEDAQSLAAALWQRHRIQSMAVVFDGKLLLRVSAQVYVDEEEIAALVQALDEDGWPGRAA